jgi:hypothetical protein
VLINCDGVKITGAGVGTQQSLFFGCVNNYNAEITQGVSFSQYWYCTEIEFMTNPSKLYYSAKFPPSSVVRGMVNNADIGADITVGTTCTTVMSSSGISATPKQLRAYYASGVVNPYAVAYKNNGIAVHTITITFSDTATNSGAVRVRRITVDKTGAVIDTQTIGTDVAYGSITFTMTIDVTTVITISVSTSTGNTGRATAVCESQFT